jgi:hypothetical protein
VGSGSGGSESSHLSWVGWSSAALAWVLIVVLLGFDRPDGECDMPASIDSVRNALLPGAALIALATIGIGVVDWRRRYSRGISRQPAIATILVGIGAVLGAPAFYLAGDLALHWGC